MRKNVSSLVAMLVVVGTLAAFGPSMSFQSIANADNVEPVHYSLSGESAYAVFQSGDPTGFIQTTAFVQVTKGRVKQTGHPVSSAQASVTIHQLNYRTGEFYIASGVEPLEAGEFQMDRKLTAATLDKLFLVTDSWGASYPIEVSLSWTSTGQVETTRRTSVDKPPSMAIYHSAGTFSDADATGFMTDGLTNFAPGTALNAELGIYKLMQLQVYFGQ